MEVNSLTPLSVLPQCSTGSDTIDRFNYIDEDKEETKGDELGETTRHVGLALRDHGDEVNEDVFEEEVKSRGAMVTGAGTLKQSLMQAAIAEAQSLSTTLPVLPPQRRGEWGRSTATSKISELIQKAKKDGAKHWARSFYHLDPRWQILTFFIDLALEGVENLELNDGIIQVDCREKFPLLLRAFAKVGVFSVWRPTSNDAIRKMVTGDGVGKGLDIKGKSALKGKYSGFVPFLQISNNEDKVKVSGMTADGRLRIFYPNQSSRDKAANLLKPLRNMMVQLVVGEAENTMSDPRIHKIDDYASSSDKGAFGLDIPEKLFWEAYVVRNDITREVDSEYDTGRPSMPEFQGMNLDTLRKKPPENGNSDPHPVLYHAGCGSKNEFSENANPLCPLDLLMAYEENDDVTAVVSDFDCFLVGTRGVKFNESLGEQELSVLTECVDEIEGILSTPQDGVGWTRRWLEVKKKQYRNAKSGKHQEMPKFGYADPRSYTMMKGAVHRLNGSGAVRHGPECFNYGFPQDLDDSFLVISDTLPGKVPWKYVNAAELKDILRDKIDEGFTFPMNPKWILCDPGWKLLYDKLLASDRSDTQESMGIWYPEDIQRRINEISTKFPDGFVDCNDHVSVDLAEMELKEYEETVAVEKTKYDKGPSKHRRKARIRRASVAFMHKSFKKMVIKPFKRMISIPS